jgi:hypothetical protein
MPDKEITAEQVITYIRKNGQDIFFALLHEHRTLQQATICSLYNILKSYSTTDYDLRNEQAIMWAKEATNIKYSFPFI